MVLEDCDAAGLEDAWDKAAEALRSDAVICFCDRIVVIRSGLGLVFKIPSLSTGTSRKKDKCYIAKMVMTDHQCL